MSPPPASDAEAARGGSASAPAAGANVAEDEQVDVVPSPIRQREGKALAVEASVSDVTLTAPHFVPADFATRLKITPFVDGVCQVITPTEGLGLFTELNEFGESCTAVESLFVQGLAAHLSAKKSALERLNGYRLCLRKSEEDLRRKEDERRVVAETLKKANAESRSLCSDLEAVRKRDAERDRQLASAKEKIKSLEARLASAKATAATLVPAIESAKEACYTLRLALNDLGVRAEGAPGEGGTALDFSEWT
uniref:Uncharacterized protein n=1 Tax=Oryza meridionalis TaxID=40149 RepID=A0A0E0D2M6_9ORYZ